MDLPLPVQYLNWLGDFLRGDWGISYSTNLPIYPMVMDRLRNSLILAMVALIISVPFAVTLGVIAGLNANKPIDNTISVGSLAVVGLPEFVTGLVLIQVFSFGLRDLGLPHLPANSSIPPGASFLEILPMLILPALTAMLVLLAYIARLTRAGVLQESATALCAHRRPEGLTAPYCDRQARPAQRHVADYHGDRDQHRLADQRLGRDRKRV